MEYMGKVCHNSKGSPSGSVFIKFNTNYISYGVIFLSEDNLSESDSLFISPACKYPVCAPSPAHCSEVQGDS